MSNIDSLKIGQQVCKALGLDPNSVSGLTLDFQAGEIPVATVDMTILNEQGEHIANTLKRYMLVEDGLGDENFGGNND